MTRKISITVPDEVAAYLDEQPNASAEAADALTVRIISRRAAQIIAEAGYNVTETGKATMRARLEALRAQRTTRA